MKYVIIALLFCLQTSFVKIKQIEVLVTGYSTPKFEFQYFKSAPFIYKQELIRKSKSYIIWTKDILICEQTKLEGFAYITDGEITLLVEQIKGCLKQSKYKSPVDNRGIPLKEYKSIAVDNDIIKRNNIVMIDDNKFEPTDVGSKINGFHIDIYMGTNKIRADTTKYKKVVSIY